MGGGHLSGKLESESVSPPILDLEGGGEGELESEEGQAVRLKVVGKPPSLKELEEHMSTHLPFRNWCRHCVSGRGQSDQHRKQLEQEEQEVPVISIDYAYLGEEKTGGEDEYATNYRHEGQERRHHQSSYG